MSRRRKGPTRKARRRLRREADRHGYADLGAYLASHERALPHDEGGFAHDSRSGRGRRRPGTGRGAR